MNEMCRISRGVFVVLSSFLGFLASAQEPGGNWPNWRGPSNTGASSSDSMPVFWSEDENIRWKVSLPGRGHSTPIIWDDLVFLTTAIPTGKRLSSVRRDPIYGNADVQYLQEFAVMAIDRWTGTVTWKTTVREMVPREGGHVTGSLASPSATTDGASVYVSFGSRGLYRLDFQGNVIWRKEFDELVTRNGRGEGSTPVLHKKHLLVNYDHEGQSKLYALDKLTGDVHWHVDRDEPTSWATPIVVDMAGQAQVVVSGTNAIRSYDLANGNVIWHCDGLSQNVISSPVFSDGVLFASSNFDTETMLAIKVNGASGDISASKHIAWARTRNTPYVSSPLVYHGSLFFVRQNLGIVYRVNALTGQDAPGEVRLPGLGTVYSSPVAANGNVYVTSRSGATVVLRDDDSFAVLSVNELDDSFSASAAIAGGEIFLRGSRYLYCISVD